jgi:hypothetical protein
MLEGHHRELLEYSLTPLNDYERLPGADHSAFSAVPGRRNKLKDFPSILRDMTELPMIGVPASTAPNG